jgi:hypothetical protein
VAVSRTTEDVLAVDPGANRMMEHADCRRGRPIMITIHCCGGHITSAPAWVREMQDVGEPGALLWSSMQAWAEGAQEHEEEADHADRLAGRCDLCGLWPDERAGAGLTIDGGLALCSDCSAVEVE